MPRAARNSGGLCYVRALRVLSRSSMRLLDHNLLHYKDPLTPVDLFINLSFFLFPPMHTHFPW